MNERVRAWRPWAPDAAVALVVLFFGLVSAQDAVVGERPYADVLALVVVVAFAAAVGLFRRAPGLALGLVWAACAVQVLIGMSPLAVQVTMALVAYGCARWGSTATVVLSGLSIPASVVVAFAAVASGLYFPFTSFTVRQLLDSGYRYVASAPFLGLGLAMLVLGGPWLAGLAVRFLERARTSRVSQEEAEADAARATSEREQAQEIARLREDQARLAGDVHDVVGHSLAVILAQAESGQYLPDDDPARLKQTLATIATSARTSLHDVRQVLASTRGEARPEPRAGALDELVEGVRRSGHRVESQEIGRPQPLPPDLAEVAYRVLQEMLTNAIRHGDRTAPVTVERHWEGDLRIEVGNRVVAGGSPSPDDAWSPPGRSEEDTAPLSAVAALVHEDTAGAGQGLVGMRRRLESVDGRLDVRRRESTFTVTAWLPVRR